MVKKTIILLVLYFLCSVTLLVCGEKNILPRSRVFFAPWSQSRSTKNTRSRSRLGKKSGAGAGARAAKKFAGSPALNKALLVPNYI
jgi:hypothetical protein